MNKLDIQTQISDAIFRAQTRNSHSGKVLEDSVHLYSTLGIAVCVGSVAALLSIATAVFFIHQGEIIRVLKTLIWQ